MSRPAAPPVRNPFSVPYVESTEPGRWPDLPVGIRNGVGARLGNRLIVGLGSAGAAMFALDLRDKAAGWRPIAPFVGPPLSGAAAAVSHGCLFVFGGSGLPAAGCRSAVVLDGVHRYDPRSDQWTCLDTTTPVGLLGASAVTLSDERIGLIGGYNKPLFDRYVSAVDAIDAQAEPERLRRLVASYMGMRPEDYFWNDAVVVFDPLRNRWSNFGRSSHLPNTGSAILTTAPDEFLVISGEIKPGLRTNQTRTVRFASGRAVWKDLKEIPAPDGESVHEGLAGAFSGTVAGLPVIAGGTNFRGARANAEAGRWYAHDGLRKRWTSDILRFDGIEWTLVGRLPHGRAHGVSFTIGEELLIVGGEDQAGAALQDIIIIRSLEGQMFVT